MNTDTLNKGIVRCVRLNFGGDAKAKIEHPVKWEYKFNVNSEDEAETFLRFRAYSYAARNYSLQEDAEQGIITKDTPPMSQEAIRALAIEAVMSPNETRKGGGGGNPALAAAANKFAPLVKSGVLARDVAIGALATGKTTKDEATTALDKALAKLA